MKGGHSPPFGELAKPMSPIPRHGLYSPFRRLGEAQFRLSPATFCVPPFGDRAKRNVAYPPPRFVFPLSANWQSQCRLSPRDVLFSISFSELRKFLSLVWSFMFALSSIGQLSTTSISCVILFLLFSRLNEVDIRESFVPPKKEITIGNGNNLAQRTQKFILSEAKRG